MDSRLSTAETVEDVIEGMGLGWAQISTALLAQGVFLADCVEFAMVTALIPRIAEEFHLNSFQMASLASFVYLGLVVGCFMGGYLGDKFGRRLPICCCYFAVGCCSLLCTFAKNYETLACLRFILGTAMGSGMPPCLALVSEMSPPSSRMAFQGMRSVYGILGSVSAYTILVFDDPSLLTLHWRVCLTISAIPPLVLGCLAFLFLKESPIYLTEAGNLAEAKAVLNWIKKQNRSSAASTLPSTNSIEDPPALMTRQQSDAKQGKVFQQISWKAQLAIIFGRHFLMTTLVLSAGSFVVNFVDFGLSYSDPKVFQTTASGFPAGVELLVKQTVDACLEVIGIGASLLYLRKTNAIASFLLMFFGIFTFIVLGSVNHLNAVEGIGYFFSEYAPVAGTALGFVIIYQASAEIYPTLAAASGSAFIVGFGRIGAIVAPLVFETFTIDHWQLFYFVMGSCALLAAILFCIIDSATLGGVNKDNLKPLTAKDIA